MTKRHFPVIQFTLCREFSRNSCLLYPPLPANNPAAGMPAPLNKLHFLVKATNSKFISTQRCPPSPTTQFFNSSSFMHHLTVQSIDRNEIGTKIKMAFVQCFGETTKHRFYFQCKLCFIHLFCLLCRFVTSLKCFSCTNAFSPPLLCFISAFSK